MTKDAISLHAGIIAAELRFTIGQVEAAAKLLDEGATIPFIARYRKEATGSLDETNVAAVRDRLEKLRELDKRREAVLASLAERELLTDALRQAVEAAPTLAALEDVYLPYRPKRRTRAMIAREKGLAPLAELLLARAKDGGPCDPRAVAAKYVAPDKGVADVEEALAGARDVIAEMVSEDAETRAGLRGLFAAKGVLRSALVKGQEEAGAKFRDWFDFAERVATIPSHRLLAVLRGEREGALAVSIRPPEDEASWLLRRRFPVGRGAVAEQMELALADAYKRLVAPSLETEIRRQAKERADAEAIGVFTANLREMLLASPLGQKRVLALDPGFRTGAKLAVLDAQGKLLHHGVVYPVGSEKQVREAGEVVKGLVEKHRVEAVAVGSGTAGRETEEFVRSLGLPPEVMTVMVDERGASVYSASDSAREEFPDLDLTLRSAASIGRRLMDPLAELVKIDPKSIGVGQYQHDVDQAALGRGLDEAVESCVSAVGVELNTASRELLSRVPGVGPALAKNIVSHRQENGPFRSRKELKKVPRLGPKAFEQAAGFLRIAGGADPLDGSAVHPESYAVVQRMAKSLGVSVAELMKSEEKRARIRLTDYVEGGVGLPTLTDIMAELAKPGRDPRERFEPVRFAENVHAISDLTPGMRLPGVVTNVAKFGAFVDVGVHQDGLVHVSQLADRFVKDPAEVVKVGQKVTVTVLEVDAARRRIALSLKSDPSARPERRAANGPDDRQDARHDLHGPREAERRPVRSSAPAGETPGRRDQGERGNPNAPQTAREPQGSRPSGGWTGTNLGEALKRGRK